MTAFGRRSGADVSLARGLERREVLGGVIGGAGQWACGHEEKTFRVGDALIRLELLGCDKAVNGRMLPRRLEILADGEEIDARLAQICLLYTSPSPRD